MSFYLKRHKIAVLFYILTVILACICSACYTILMANFLSKITVGEIVDGIRLLILSLVANVFCRIGWWVNYYLYVKYSNIIWKEIAKDLTRRSFELSVSTFSDNNSGSFVQRIMNDPNKVLASLSSLVEVFAETITGFVMVVYIITLNWIIGISFVIVLISMFILELFRKKVLRRNELKSKKVGDKTYSLVSEIIKSETDIKALGLENELNETSDASFEKYQARQSKTYITDTHFWNSRCLVLEVFAVLVLFLGIYLMNRDMLTISAFILLYSYSGNLYGLVWNVGSILKSATEISVGTTRMFSLFDENFYPAEKFGDKKLTDIKGEIKFDKVKYSYFEIKEPEEDEEILKKRKPIERIKKDAIFKELSFTINPNTTVAFVGKSGCGKSTILSLITKLIEADEGEISIDGLDIKTICKESLRNNITLINQFPYVFDMSIKENLLLVKKDATDEEIWEVLKRASLDEDIKSMPKKLDTKVGETGVKLSGGQRQRLAIARALLKESKIILFDESTSSLDNFAQSNIQKNIEKMKGKHTIVIVAHRLSTIKNVDKIYFLDNGKIVASGTFDELFNTNQEFQDMFLIENI